MLVLEVARLIGLDDRGKLSDEENHLLRILTPLTKLYTGKQVCAGFKFQEFLTSFYGIINYRGSGPGS